MLYILIINGMGLGSGSGRIVRISFPTPNPNFTIGKTRPRPLIPINSNFFCQNQDGSGTDPMGSSPITMPRKLPKSHTRVSMEQKQLVFWLRLENKFYWIEYRTGQWSPNPTVGSTGTILIIIVLCPSHDAWLCSFSLLGEFF